MDRKVTKKKNLWFNSECQDTISKRGLARINKMQNLTPENIDNFSKLRTLANKVIRQQKFTIEKKTRIY